MEAEAMPARDWSSLPADLVNRVAICLLSTNDLDYYMDLRGVCQHWRSATADPRSNPHKPRFHPIRWIMLDEHRLSSYYNREEEDDDYDARPFVNDDDDMRLFVNTTTGRFLRKSLPLLRSYHLVTSTVGGFVIVAEKEPPHAARVLNPFIGCMIRFKAPVPMELSMTANVVAVGDVPVLVLGSPADTCNIDELSFYLADPDSEHFSCNNVPTGSCVDRVRPSLMLVPTNTVDVDHGEILLVHRPQQGEDDRCTRVYRVHSDEVPVDDEVTNMGSRALFVGTSRCFSVDASSFPSIEANKIYRHNGERFIGTCFPVPIVALLMQYTVYPPPPDRYYKPAWQEFKRKLCDKYFNSSDDEQ